MADLALAAAWVAADALRPTADTTPCGAITAEAPEDEVIDDAALAASEFLHAASGYRYPGVKTGEQVSPCSGDRCACVDGRLAPLLVPGEGYPVDCGCGDGGSCCGPRGVTLGVAPVVAVSAVTLNGSPFTDFELVGDVLARTDGGTWPRCQDLTAPGFTVTFSWGVAPPSLGVLAARDLTCLLVRAEMGDATCVEPANVVRKTGGGMTVEVSSPTGDLLASLPRSVRLFLHAHGPRPAPSIRRPRAGRRISTSVGRGGARGCLGC